MFSMPPVALGFSCNGVMHYALTIGRMGLVSEKMICHIFVPLETEGDVGGKKEKTEGIHE